VAAAVLADTSFAEVTEAPADGYLVDLEDANGDLKPEDIFSDQAPWYDYKLEFTSYYFEEDTDKNHFPTFRWAQIPGPEGAADGGINDTDGGAGGADGGMMGGDGGVADGG
jgi:hypothetical protein